MEDEMTEHVGCFGRITNVLRGGDVTGRDKLGDIEGDGRLILIFVVILGHNSVLNRDYSLLG
jgi:hypothetical protein